MSTHRPPVTMAATVHAPLAPRPLAISEEVPVELAFEERYVGAELLGRGGMGVVERYTDRITGRDVAMKVSLAPSDPRFLREARIQARLEHPSIVPVYDLGVSPSGTPYFTMKRVRGRTLDELRVEGTPARRLLGYLVNVCLAIDFAHAHGVLHRDLKPSNVMVGDFGEVYVLDWGVAKLVAGEESALPSSPPSRAATRVGELVGTPAYMAPEQARGEAPSVATDVFALGAMLFEILTGQTLNDGTSSTEALAKARGPMDARPSVRAPQAQVAPELEAICVKATAFEPEARYASARDLHAALQAYLDGDRDLEMRREAARAHAETAERRARLAIDEPDDAVSDDHRTVALAEVGRALALDPVNEVAMKTLVSLLTTPPKHVPAAVARELEAAEIATGRVAARAWTLSVIGILAVTPFLFWMGLRDAPLFGAAVAMLAMTAVFVQAVPRAGRWGGALVNATLLCAAVFVGIATRICGPLMHVPILALGASVAISFHPRVRNTVIAPVLAIASLLVPLALELAGVIEPSYSFEGDRTVIYAHLVSMPAIPSIVYHASANGSAIVLLTLYFARIRSAFLQSQREVLLQRWQLSQLVPTR